MKRPVHFLPLCVGLLIVLLAGCKKPANDSPAPVAGLTLVGNWKITAITFSPGWVQYTGATPITDLIAHLNARGETCLSNVTLSFTAAGKASPDSDCNSLPDSRIFLDYLFGNGGTTFTETDTQAVLYGKDKISSLALTKGGTNQQLTIAFTDDEDLSSNKITTTYTVKLARQ